MKGDIVRGLQKLLHFLYLKKQIKKDQFESELSSQSRGQIISASLLISHLTELSKHSAAVPRAVQSFRNSQTTKEHPCCFIGGSRVTEAFRKTIVVTPFLPGSSVEALTGLAREEWSQLGGCFTPLTHPIL